MYQTSGALRRVPAGASLVNRSLQIPSRFTALDGWRGVCALLVAVYHFQTTSHLEHLAFVRHSYLFVDFFFVLSGFVIAYAYGDRLGTLREAAIMIWRRLGRLWPLHVAILLAFLTLEVAIPLVAQVLHVERSAASAFDPGSASQSGAVITNLLLFHGLGLHDRLTWNQPSWSISAEFWTYVLYAAIVMLARRWAVAVSLLLLGAALATLVLVSDRFLAVDYDYGILRCIVGFLAGSLVLQIVKARRVALPMPTFLEGGAVLAIVAFVVWAGRSPMEFAAPFVFAAAVWLFAHEQGRISAVLKTPPLSMLGLISYSIYMVHSLLITLVHRASTAIEQALGIPMTTQVVVEGVTVRYVSFAGPWVMDAFVALYVLAVIGTARITWAWIEMPGQRTWNQWPGEPGARPAIRSSATA